MTDITPHTLPKSTEGLREPVRDRADESERIGDFSPSSPGVALHGNAMHLGPPGVYPPLEVILPTVGAAHAALDEFERLTRTRTAAVLGGGPRIKGPFYQRDFGLAKIKAEQRGGDRHAHPRRLHEVLPRRGRRHPPLPRRDRAGPGLHPPPGRRPGLRGGLDTLWRSAGSSAAAKGRRMQRSLRDVAMFRTPYAARFNANAQRYGALSLGEPPF